MFPARWTAGGEESRGQGGCRGGWALYFIGPSSAHVLLIVCIFWARYPALGDIETPSTISLPKYTPFCSLKDYFLSAFAAPGSVNKTVLGPSIHSLSTKPSPSSMGFLLFSVPEPFAYALPSSLNAFPSTALCGKHILCSAQLPSLREACLPWLAGELPLDPHNAWAGVLQYLAFSTFDSACSACVCL